VAIRLTVAAGEPRAKADIHSVWRSVASGCSLTTNAGSFATGGARISTSNGGNVTLVYPLRNTGPGCDAIGSINAFTLLSKGSSTSFGGAAPSLLKEDLSTGAETTICRRGHDKNNVYHLSEHLDLTPTPTTPKFK
jgi:hypothetical protein